MTDKNMKEVKDLTSEDLTIIELSDGRVFVGFCRGSSDRFIYLYGPMQLHSEDTSDITKARFFPHLFGYTKSTRGFNFDLISTVSGASPAVCDIYDQAISEQTERLIVKKTGGTADILKEIEMGTERFDIVERMVIKGKDQGTKH